MASRFTSSALRSLQRRPVLPNAHAAVAARRNASSSASLPRRFLSTTIILGVSGAFVAYYYDSRSLMHEHIAMPIMRLFDPETGHKAAIKLLSSGKLFRPRDIVEDGAELHTELFGMRISNPVGMAAGFDKDADAIDGLFDLGFGYVEVGSVTPEPQPGNPKPRFFRLPEDEAAINRYGFNSLGHAHTLLQLRTRLFVFAREHPSLFPSPMPLQMTPPEGMPRSLRPGHLLAVNLGKNKTSAADSNDDYVKGVRTLGPFADIVVINVSSPNTPGLRALQGREILERLLKEVVSERDRIANGSGLPKIAVKVACDLSEEELGDVASAVRNSGVEGVIISNTTLRREGLKSYNKEETGGLSGRPLLPHALASVKTLRPLLPPSIPVIGCGGITTGADALQYASAGASLVQLYTSFGYRGVGTPRLLKDEISAGLKGSSWTNVVGRDYQGKSMGWDAKRVEQEGEALKREAEDLGRMLRQAHEEGDMARLIQEAEAALKGAAAAKPRDNLAGAAGSPPPAEEKPASSGAIETGNDRTAGAIDAPVHSTTGRSPLQLEFARAVGRLVPHRATDLGPVVVPVENPAAPPPAPVQPQNPVQTDPWASEVRSGQRRLV